MKKILLIAVSTLLFADLTPLEGLERASAPHKWDACELAKATARENYDIENMNVGCTCEKDDSKKWMCFIRFTYLPKAEQE